jgi:predicted dehydrogenase
LRAGSAAFTLPYFVPGQVLGQAGQLGANETVRIGVVGLGGRARGLVSDCLQNVRGYRLVAISDCFAPLFATFLAQVKKAGFDGPCATYEDCREMFTKEKLDGVMVQTTTHARAWVCAHAMQAGLDVYIEKPMCLTVAEGRYLVNAARKWKRVTQVGSQQRSMPINNWASDLVKNGAIGKVHTVLAPNFIGPQTWTNQPPQPLPEGGCDGWWDVWTNQAPLRPYHSQLHHGWASWRDYDGGGKSFGVTGWGTHSYDQVNRALGTDETGPVEVLLEEPVRASQSGKFKGDRAKVTMTFTTGTKLKLHLESEEGPGLGAIFVGDRGKIEINRGRVASNPKELVESPDNPGKKDVAGAAPHVANWLECIKTRARCNADVEFGQRSTTLCYLVNIARDLGRVGEVLKWDPASERFTNCDEANLHLARPRRRGYELP